MKSVTLIAFMALLLLAFNYPKPSKFGRPTSTKVSVADDTTKIDYWKQRARLAEKEAKQQAQNAERNGNEARTQKMLAEKNAMQAANQARICQEATKTVADLHKQLQDCKKK